MFTKSQLKIREDKARRGKGSVYRMGYANFTSYFFSGALACAKRVHRSTVGEKLW